MTTYAHQDLELALEALSDSALAATEYEVARAVVIAATLAHRTIATAESLTAGLVAATIASVPGASQVLRGGIVAYATEVKAELLDVPQALLSRGGAVQPQVAETMAAAARRKLHADFGLGCTGVAGPDAQDGHPVGEVHVAVAGPEAIRTHSLQLAGDRDAIRHGTALVVLGMLLDALLPLVDVQAS